MMRASNEASTSTDVASTTLRNRTELALDLVAAVKGLHELSPQQLSKLIRDSGNNVVQHTAEDGSQIQVDMEKFARYLPLHLIAVIMAWERDKSTFKYLLCGILLLHSLCDVTCRAPKIEQILLDDVKVSEQQIDLVFYLLVLLGAFKQEIHDISNDMVLLHSALVACSLKLLIVIVSPQYQEVTQVLVAYHKVDIFMDSTFSAVCIDVKFLHTKLSADQTESSADTTPSPEETLTHLFQQCDSSLHFLQSLCQQKMFRECIVKNKELCRHGGILVLVRAVMNLKLSHIHSMSTSSVTSVSRLKTKALSILLYLCEAESVSYLDEIASNTRSQNLSKSIALQVLELLKKMFGVNSRQLPTSSQMIYPKGQLELNAMHLVEILSDDSNYRSFIMINFTEALAAMFLCPHGEFLSGWCSSDLPVCEDDTALDVPRASYAHQRTSLLIKMIANLHCHAPDVCQDEKDLFLHKFVRFIQNESRKQSNGCPSNPIAEKSAIAGKNLGSLLSHAESLVPRFLNEDDVQLLRLFINQYDALIVRVGSEDLVQHAQTTEECCTSLHKELPQNHGNNGISVNEGKQENVASLEANQLDDSRNLNNQSLDGERKSGMVELGKYNGSTAYLREIEREARTVETSGSDSSPTRGKNLVDRLDGDQVRGSVFEDTLDDEKIDATHSDEKQQRKRKRTVMNDKQIALIESALVDEPDMHRNAASLQSWADKLSLHGAEVSTSRLKNWLNNRKARLARAAKDVRVSYDSESVDRQGCSGQLDSPQSPVDDTRVSSAARGNARNEDTALTSNIDADTGTILLAPGDIVRSGPFFEPGQYVMLVDEKADEIGKGKVYQVHGKWCGRVLDQSGMCVVDIVELTVDRFAKVLHPMEVTGNTYDQAEKRLGLIRVLWDLNKLLKLPPH